MKQGIRIVLGLLLALVATTTMLQAQSVADKDLLKLDGKYLVVDSAQVFSATTRLQLEQALVNFDKQQSTQIAVVTIKNLGNYEISQYSTALAHKAGIGREGKDNGVLILFALQNKQVHIATGYGVEGALTDGLAGTIIRNEMIPLFKVGDYEGGLVKGAQAVMQAVTGEYQNTDKKYGATEEAPPVIGLVLVVLFIIFIIAFMGRRGGGNNNGGRGGGQYMSRRGSDFLTGMILGNILNGGRGGGGGDFGGGGGGFGGFGGGGFGGGGASGSW